MTLFGKTINYEQITTTFVKGVATKTPVSSTFNGTVQPMTGKDLELVEVGREDRGKVKIYSDIRLNVGIAGSDKSGDVVEWQGEKWEIIQEMKFQNNLINHYKYFGEFRERI